MNDGGVKLSIRFRLAKSYGLDGATSGASRAAPPNTTTISVATTATGERRN